MITTYRAAHDIDIITSAKLDAVRQFQPSMVLSSHLPAPPRLDDRPAAGLASLPAGLIGLGAGTLLGLGTA